MNSSPKIHHRRAPGRWVVVDTKTHCLSILMIPSALKYIFLLPLYSCMFYHSCNFFSSQVFCPQSGVVFSCFLPLSLLLLTVANGNFHFEVHTNNKRRHLKRKKPIWLEGKNHHRRRRRKSHKNKRRVGMIEER